MADLYQRLLAELTGYFRAGAEIVAKDCKITPRHAVKTLSESPGCYMIEVRRDQSGAVKKIILLPAGPDDFDKSGRFTGRKKADQTG